MSTVMVICPVACRQISTGIETEADVLKGIPRVMSAVHCAECGEKHFWTCEDAMLNDGATPSSPDARP
jgi:hypothetical protein